MLNTSKLYICNIYFRFRKTEIVITPFRRINKKWRITVDMANESFKHIIIYIFLPRKLSCLTLQTWLQTLWFTRTEHVPHLVISWFHHLHLLLSFLPPKRNNSTNKICLWLYFPHCKIYSTNSLFEYYLVPCIFWGIKHAENWHWNIKFL